MKKIPTLFKRNYAKHKAEAYNEVTEGCEWVLAGEGIATFKHDGTCCKVDNGVLFKRYDAKHGKAPPNGFIPAQDPDPITGHWPGWLVVDDSPENKWHNEGWKNAFRLFGGPLPDGTYELVGPKIGGNPDNHPEHTYMKHGDIEYPDFPRDFDSIKSLLTSNHWVGEGVVFRRENGDMCKIKKKDFVKL